MLLSVARGVAIWIDTSYGTLFYKHKYSNHGQTEKEVSIRSKGTREVRL